MAVKYTIPFYDDDNVLWRVDIDLPSYSGASKEIVGVGRTFLSINYGQNSEDIFEPIIGSSAEINFYNQNDDVDIYELQTLPDLTGRVLIYKNSTLEWSGFILTDGIQRNYSAQPFVVNITATDGLQMLDNVEFVGPSNRPLPDGAINRSPLAFVRDILFSSNHLGNILPIRYTSNVVSDRYGYNGFAGGVQWGSLGEGWKDLNGNNKSCLFVLKGLLQAFQLRIYQVDGKWVIERVNDITTGVYNWKEIAGTFTNTAPAFSSGTTDANDTCVLVNENQVFTVKAALTGTEVTYNSTQAENNVPNGGFEMTSLGYPLYWTLTRNPAGRASIGIYEEGSINGRPGNSLDAVFPIFGTPIGDYAELSFSGTMPVDANILFKTLGLGFKFMPLNGFQYWTSGADTGFINFDSTPLQIKVIYNINDGSGSSISMYLNSWGFWQTIPPSGQSFLSMTSSKVGNTWSYTFSGYPLADDFVSIKYVYTNGGVTTRPTSTYTAVNSDTGNLNGFLNNLRAKMDADLPWTVTRSGNTISLTHPVGTLNDDGTSLQNRSNGITSDGYINISVPRMKIGDVADIVFRGRGGNTDILMPDPSPLGNITSGTIGVMKIWFRLNEGFRYVLDDVYLNFNENNDVYLSQISGSTRKTNLETKSMDISSAFTGFKLTNIMNSYDSSNLDYKFSDGKYIGSLTGMTANANMRIRHKAREVFSGDIYVRGKDWRFNTVYNIDGKKFLPLSSRYNVETCTVNIVAMEVSDDNPTLTEKHYGTNERLLSNT